MPTATSKKRLVDLNKMRAARLEAIGEGPLVEFGDLKLQLPPELPFIVVEAFGKLETASGEEDGYRSATAIIEAVRGLLGEKQFEAFMKEQPSSEDMGAFIEGVLGEYGVSAGESEASPES